MSKSQIVHGLLVTCFSTVRHAGRMLGVPFGRARLLGAGTARRARPTDDCRSSLDAQIGRRGGLRNVLVAVPSVILASCGDGFLAPAAIDCVTNPSQHNACKLDGITAVAEKQDPDDDDDDDDEDGGEGDNDDDDEGRNSGGRTDGSTESECNDDQLIIASEYENETIYQGSGEWPCHKFTTPAGSIGGSEGKHGHQYGYLDPEYITGRDWVLAEATAAGIVNPQMSSEWRCPEGNSKVGRSRKSKHMEGTAGDFWAPGFNEMIFNEYLEIARQAKLQKDGASWHYTEYQDGDGTKRHMHIQW